jgi:transposase
MKKQSRKHTAEFKALVAIESIQGLKILSEIAKEYEVHPVMVGNWKKEMLERLPELYQPQNAKKDQTADKEKEGLHRKVGQLTMEADFLEKKCKQLGIPGKGRNS